MAEIVLTAEQKAVLAHDRDYPARVLAGPGTGKSATLVALIGKMVKEKPAPRVRLLTFTRAATAELANKLEDHPAAIVERPSTIHSFAISVLLRNGSVGDLPRPLRIADDWERHEIVRPTLARRAGVGVKRLDLLLRELAANWESLAPHEEPRLLPPSGRSSWARGRNTEQSLGTRFYPNSPTHSAARCAITLTSRA